MNLPTVGPASHNPTPPNPRTHARTAPGGGAGIEYPVRAEFNKDSYTQKWPLALVFLKISHVHVLVIWLVQRPTPTPHPPWHPRPSSKLETRDEDNPVANAKEES